mmetsp:Transcript_23153/g.50318  ORF Transcript_23153/g.50318 Transcript_23153/m.50318 type:complete len:232 (+) Transcript_23153:540-1235(+)
MNLNIDASQSCMPGMSRKWNIGGLGWLGRRRGRRRRRRRVVVAARNIMGGNDRVVVITVEAEEEVVVARTRARARARTTRGAAGQGQGAILVRLLLPRLLLLLMLPIILQHPHRHQKQGLQGRLALGPCQRRTYWHRTYRSNPPGVIWRLGRSITRAGIRCWRIVPCCLQLIMVMEATVMTVIMQTMPMKLFWMRWRMGRIHCLVSNSRTSGCSFSLGMVSYQRTMMTIIP